MRHRRFLALLLTLALLVGLTPVLAAGRFADVKQGSWYYDAVERCAESGLVNGVSATRFDPKGTMTRAMVVTILYRMGGGVTAAQPADFADVPDGVWYADAVAWARENGVAEGVGGGRFAPKEPVTREQLVTLLWRYADMRYENDFDRFYAEQAFSDADPVSAWAQDAMRLSIGAGIVRGRGDGWHAKALCTRAEAVTMLDRFAQLELTDKEPGVLIDLTPAQLDTLADRSLQLFNAMDKPGNNPIASPLSALYALAMLYNGASGETAEQLAAFFDMTPEETNTALAALSAALPDGFSTVRLANALWLRQGEPVEPDFIAANRDQLSAEVFRRDFGGDAVKEINDWVSKQTDGMIPSIISSLPSDALLVLLNAILFKAQWGRIYEITQERDFHAESGETERAQMLMSVEYTYLHDAHAEGFLKPFLGSRYAFAVLVPEMGMSPEAYLAGLTGTSLRALLTGERYDAVHTGMPVLTAELQTDLTKAFSKVGLTNLNDLTGISEDAYVSGAVHRAKIEINENGVSAAAATAITLAGSAAPKPDPKEATVIADRPYVYMIVDTQTNLPLFIGTVDTVA
ncbi:MAG: S-layer homology domain-containing protein [Oscillospiraceae bacterium]|nr:S-layer homology domain-containing protein [Oscillospiraceae bacterium]